MTALDGSGSWTDPTDPRNRDPALIARVAAWLEPLYSSYFRFRTRGEEHLPRTGNAIFVGLHSGAPLLPEVWLDLVWWVANRGAEDPVYALIHDAALRIPGLRGFLLRLGALRASRRSAERVLETGASLLIYPGGELETQRTFWRRNVVDFHGNSGFARLALRYGVSIVPVAHVGGHEVYFTLATSRRLARWTGMARWLRIQTGP
jgi:1-acyl-sn-glycerol-3-phosphate acyltransferase